MNFFPGRKKPGFSTDCRAVSQFGSVIIRKVIKEGRNNNKKTKTRFVF